jgi:hypothetical protein
VLGDAEGEKCSIFNLATSSFLHGQFDEAIYYCGKARDLIGTGATSSESAEHLVALSIEYNIELAKIQKRLNQHV